MNIESFRKYCLQKVGATEDFPFDNQTLVFKVLGKMFALTDLTLFESVNLKCAPEKALQLRAAHLGVTPGYHMNKKHWNTIHPEEGELSDKELNELINHSYELVVASLPKKLREELAEL